MVNMNEFIEHLKTRFALETCHHSYQSRWSIENPSIGHCAIAAIAIQEKFGGDVFKTKIGNSTHYYNVIDNQIIDSTSEQFGKIIDYSKGIICNVKKMLLVKDTKLRYEILKSKI